MSEPFFNIPFISSTIFVLNNPIYKVTIDKLTIINGLTISPFSLPLRLIIFQVTFIKISIFIFECSFDRISIFKCTLENTLILVFHCPLSMLLSIFVTLTFIKGVVWPWNSIHLLSHYLKLIKYKFIFLYIF